MNEFPNQHAVPDSRRPALAAIVGLCALLLAGGCLGGDIVATNGGDEAASAAQERAERRINALAQAAPTLDVVTQATLDNGREVEVLAIPDYRCFQPNERAADELDDADTVYLAEGWGSHEFFVVYPHGVDPLAPTPFPALVYLKGGGYAWVDTAATPATDDSIGIAWGSVEGEGVLRDDMLLSTQWWNRKQAFSEFSGAPLEENPAAAGSADSWLNRFLDRYPDWGVIYPSYCSRDLYGGTGALGLDGRRYGFAAVTAAVAFLDAAAGLDGMLVAGNSAGGIGAAVMARDLPPAVAPPLLGAVVSSGPANAQAWAQLHDADQATGGWRRIADDDGDEAWLLCADPAHDFTTGIKHIDAVDLNISADLDADRIEVPVYHVWNRRDHNTLCGDAAYSATHLDGDIADALAASAIASTSVNDELCTGSTTVCRDDNPPLDGIDSCAQTAELACTDHGLLKDSPALSAMHERLFAWVEERMADLP